MTAFLRGESPIAAATSVVPLTLSLPTRYPGDIVLVATVVAQPNGAALPTNEIASSVPAMDAISAPVGDTKTKLRIWAFNVNEDNASGPVVITLASGLSTGGSVIFAAKAWIFGGGDAIATFNATGPYTAAAGATPVLPINDPNTLAVRLYLASSATLATPQAVFTAASDDYTGIGLGAGFSLSTAVLGSQSGSTASTAPAAPTLSEYAFFAVGISPAAVPSTPGTAPPALLRLGTATSYEVFITRNDPTTQIPDVVDRVGWSSITWERVLDDISEASVDIPDKYGGVRCCAKFGGLRPWTYGLRIERNDQLVWQGPVTGVSRPTGDDGSALPLLQVRAKDILARFTKRLATRSVSLPATNTDAGVLFATIMSTSQIADLTQNGFVLDYPTVKVGAGITREVVARDFEYAWDVMKDLLDAAVDAYVMNGILYVFKPGTGWRYNLGADDLTLAGPMDAVSGELLYGLFTEASFADRPGWDISGDAQANVGWEPGADSGEQGARRYWTSQDTESIAESGVLDVVDPSPLYRSVSDDVTLADAAYQRAADSLVRQRADPPAVTSGGTLAADAPVDMDNLRPGAIWRMDVKDHCYGQLLQNVRLKRVTVEVTIDESGLVEKVSPTLFPVGFTEADLS